MTRSRCTCNPRAQFTWVDEDCPAHGREAEEARVCRSWEWGLCNGIECPTCNPDESPVTAGLIQ